jgi:hypothetical protein
MGRTLLIVQVVFGALIALFAVTRIFWIGATLLFGPSPLVRTAAIVLLLYAFLLGIKGLGDGFELLGGDLLDGFFAATENPFIGLIVGLLATTVVQSSSVTPPWSWRSWPRRATRSRWPTPCR